MMARLELKVQWSARAGPQLAQTALFNSRAVQGGRQSTDVFPAALLCDTFPCSLTLLMRPW